MAHVVKNLFFMTLLALLSVHSGCTTVPPQTARVDLTSSAYLTLFLNTPQPDNHVLIQIDTVEIYAESLWYPLDSSLQPPADSEPDTTTTQQLLAAGTVATGSYDRIRFQLQIFSNTGKLLRQEQTELNLPTAMEVKPGDSSTIFITNHVSLNALETPLAQQFTAYAQQRPLADELLYILCPEIQTLYVSRVNPCQVIAAYGVGRDIADMVIDNNNQQLYLLDRQQRLVQRFDTIAQTFTDRIPLPLADEPSSIGISADGTLLYVSDSYNRQLLKISAENGTVLQQQSIGYQLGKPYPFTHQNQDYVAILSPREQQLTVLRAQPFTVQYTVNAGLQPYDVVYADQQLLVSDLFSRQILAINPESGTISARIATTQMPGTLCVDLANSNVIIGSNMNDTLAFLPFGQQLVARDTKIGGTVGDTAIAAARRLLFAALPQQHRISIIDLPSEKQISTMSVAASPRVIVFQEP